MVVFGLVVVACGDDANAGGAGGGDGAGGSSGVIVGGASGDGGAGGAGGAGVNPRCEDADFVTIEPPFVVISEGIDYQPRCLSVPVGSTVRFEDDFVTHPIEGGLVVDGEGVEDPDSPIPTTREGDVLEVVFPTEGTFDYYCESHSALGMAGTVRVDPLRP